MNSILRYYNLVALALIVILFCEKVHGDESDEDQVADVPYGYPPRWSCYDGFGKADPYSDAWDARGWMEDQAERICAKHHPKVCQQQCFFEQLKIVDSNEPALVSKEQMIELWIEKIFYDGDNSSAILIADKIHRECGELAKTIPPLANSTYYCHLDDNLWNFIECVERVWKCDMDKIPEGYPPNFSCHKGYGIPDNPFCFGECKNAPYRLRQGVSSCAEWSQEDKFCLKQCVLAQYKINNLGKPGIRPKEEMVKGLRDAFFNDGDDSSAIKLAEKIHAECGELGKNVPSTMNTTRSCDGLQEYHACVENAWKCEKDERPEELARVPKGYPPSWECHKTFGVSKLGCDECGTGTGWDASYILDSAVKLCAVKKKDECFKHCFMGELAIVHDDQETGLEAEERIGQFLLNNIFFNVKVEADMATGPTIAKKIHKECGELGKNVVGAPNTTASCDGLAEFHACVENAWVFHVNT